MTPPLNRYSNATQRRTTRRCEQETTPLMYRESPGDVGISDAAMTRNASIRVSSVCPTRPQSRSSVTYWSVMIWVPDLR